MVERALGGKLKPGIVKKPEPHILRFEHVPCENISGLDDQLLGEGMILDFDGNQGPQALMQPSSLAIESASVQEQILELSPVATQRPIEIQTGDLPPRCAEDRDSGQALEFQSCLPTRMKCTMLMTHV